MDAQQLAEAQCDINGLPDDVILDMLARLGPAERARLGATNKRMRSLDIFAITKNLKTLAVQCANNTCQMTMQNMSGECRSVIITSPKSTWLSEYLLNMRVKRLHIYLLDTRDKSISESISLILASVDCDFYISIDPFVNLNDSCDMVFPYLGAIRNPTSSSLVITHQYRVPSGAPMMTEHLRTLPPLKTFIYKSSNATQSPVEEMGAADATLLHVVSNCRMARIGKQQFTAAGLRRIVELIGNHAEQRCVVLIVPGATEREFYGRERGVTESRHDGALHRWKKLDDKGALALSKRMGGHDDYQMMIVKTNEQDKIEVPLVKKLWGSGLPEELVAV